MEESNPVYFIKKKIGMPKHKQEDTVWRLKQYYLLFVINTESRNCFDVILY